jgi:hypothetical protein
MVPKKLEEFLNSLSREEQLEVEAYYFQRAQQLAREAVKRNRPVVPVHLEPDFVDFQRIK